MIDYYEFLQISPHADAETIHRVYRYLAGRLHPDNPQSGDAEMFRLLKSAYDVLSNPARRSEYDATCNRETPQVAPLDSSIDFMDSLDGEINRRMALLAVLYFRRRANPRIPEVSLEEIERRMGFPREYLDFTTWYLVKRGYVTRADNSDFALTADGVDYIETQRASLPVLSKLLTNGSGIAPKDSAATNKKPGPIVVPAPSEYSTDRRSQTGDRRVSRSDRRMQSGGRRAGDLQLTG
jgi:curved DNA-binding protein